MPNVKPGDLCIILGSARTLSLNGRIVEVLRQSFVGDIFKRFDGTHTRLDSISSTKVWEVKSSEVLPWKTVDSGPEILHYTIPVLDIRLFKIKDKDVDMETETAKELELEKV